MSTLASVRRMLFESLKDGLTGTVSAVSGQRLTVPELVHLPDKDLNDAEVYIYGGTGIGQTRRIQTHTQSSAAGALLTPYIAWAVTPDTTSVIEVRQQRNGWTTAQGTSAIARAHYELEDIYLIEDSETLLVMETGRQDYPLTTSWRYLNAIEYDFPNDIGVPGSVYDQGALNWGAGFLNTDRGLASVTTQTKLGMPFQVTSGSPLGGFWCGGIGLYLKTVGSPASATLTLRLETASASLPSGTLADTRATATLATTAVSSTYRYHVFNFAAPVLLTSGTSYWIVASTSGSVSATDYIAWGEDTATNYVNGHAATYDSGGATWTTTSTSAFIFTALTSQINERFRKMMRDDWNVLQDESGNVLWIKDPIEGVRLRVHGQRQATAPSADTSTIEIPEAFLVPRGISLLLSMQPGGPQTDSEARDRWALAQDAIAERQLPRCRTPIKPNSRMVAAR